MIRREEDRSFTKLCELGLGRPWDTTDTVIATFQRTWAFVLEPRVLFSAANLSQRFLLSLGRPFLTLFSASIIIGTIQTIPCIWRELVSAVTRVPQQLRKRSTELVNSALQEYVMGTEMITQFACHWILY